MLKHVLLSTIALSLFFFLSSPVSYAAFTDVPSSHPNFDAIEYLRTTDFVYYENILKGYDDGSFRPDQTINRAEFTKIVIGAARIIYFTLNPQTEGFIVCDENIDLVISYPDVPLDAWFAYPICVASYYDIAQGYDDGTYKPIENINFAEAAKIIINAFLYDTQKDEVWFKPFVEALAERGAVPTSLNSFTQNITRGEMAEIIYRLMTETTHKPSKRYEDLSFGVEAPPKGSTRVSLDDTWDLYTNYELGFSFEIPKMFEPWTEGEKVSDRLLVFERDKKVHIRPEFLYPYQKDSPKTLTTLETIAAETITEENPQFWSITVKDIRNDAELAQFVRDQYGSGCEIQPMEKGAQKGTFYVNPRELIPDCLLNYVNVMIYAPDLNKAVHWNIGRDFNLWGRSDHYELRNSFLFLDVEAIPGTLQYTSRASEGAQLYLDADTNVWIEYTDGFKLQLTDSAGRTDVCGGGRKLLSASPVLSDDSQYALITVICEGDTSEIYIKEISTLKSQKVADGQFAGFFRYTDEGMLHIKIDNQLIFANPYESEGGRYTNRERTISFSLTEDVEVTEENGIIMIGAQDSIEILNKPSNQTFGDALRDLVQQAATNFADCQLSYSHDGVERTGKVLYTEDLEASDEIAREVCSPYETGSFENYFLYQPTKSKSHFAFIRHISGLDAPPYEAASIRLSD